MAKLSAYSIKVKVFCSDDQQARTVQDAVNSIAGRHDHNDADGAMTIIGSDVVGFHSYFRKNENIIVPVIKDIFRNGVGAIGKHILTLRKLK